MRKDVRTFNLSGMGCAGSIIALDAARDILATHPNTRIVIAGTENIVWNLYFGNQRSMLITNCIFRVGGVGYLLSNRASDAARAKYRLDHLVRTHLASDDEAYNAVIQREDDEGIVGVKIGKELMKVAGRALEANISALGPKVLPLSEKLLFAGNWVARKVFKSGGKRYLPDFTTAFEHFCIHPGGKVGRGRGVVGWGGEGVECGQRETRRRRPTPTPRPPSPPPPGRHRRGRQSAVPQAPPDAAHAGTVCAVRQHVVLIDVVRVELCRKGHRATRPRGVPQGWRSDPFLVSVAKP